MSVLCVNYAQMSPIANYVFKPQVQGFTVHLFNFYKDDLSKKKKNILGTSQSTYLLK